MSEEAAAPGVGAEVITHVAGGSGELSAREAGRSLSDFRNKLLAGTAEPKKDEQQNAGAETATPAQESEAVEAAEDAAPLEEAPGETPEVDPVVEEQPSVEPPRSWTKDAKEAFKLLPPALQKDVAELERSRELEIRRSQNDAADKLKGLTAKEQAAEQVRQEYETAIQGLHQELQKAKAGEFGDIKTQEDVERLANEDWPRFARWQAHQMKMNAIEGEAQRAQQRLQQEAYSKWEAFKAKETQLLNEKIPDLADKDKGAKLRTKAISLLKETGYTDQELGALDNGSMALSIHDHRFASIVVDAVKYRDEQTAKEALKKVVAKKDLPPVQRPGAGKPANAGISGEIKTLETQLSKASGLNAIRLGAKLTGLRRQAAS